MKLIYSIKYIFVHLLLEYNVVLLTRYAKIYRFNPSNYFLKHLCRLAKGTLPINFDYEYRYMPYFKLVLTDLLNCLF